MTTSKLKHYAFALALLGTTCLYGGQPAAQNSASVINERQPVAFAADELNYEQDGDILIARGNVELKQDGRVLRAQEIRYNIPDDKVEARGGVLLIDREGNEHSADYVVLRNKMRDGFIQELQTRLIDDGRIWAKEAEREKEEFRFKQARYTACKPCEDNPDATPPWQLRAREVRWDREEQMIYYKGAWFEAGGVPLFYTPYFAHPDQTVEQKSGFLFPTFGFRSQLGAFYNQDYYYALSPSQDITIGTIVTTEAGIVAKGGYRQHFGDGIVELEGSLTKSDRVDDVNNRDIRQNAEARGHIFGKMRWDVSEHWRIGSDLNLASDEQYLRQYNFEHNDVLTSRVYAERFDDRDYFQARVVGFQDLRTDSFADVDQPLLLPMLQAESFGDPNAVFGGRWYWRGSLLHLVRDGNGQDTTRLVNDANWQRRMIAPIGLVTTVDANLRADFFNTTDIDPARLNPGQSQDDTEARLFPQLHIRSELPMAKRAGSNGEFLISPQLAMTLAPNLGEPEAIPNEDSADTQLDITNLFDANRFTGDDRIEDRSRLTYGMKAGYYDHEGRYADVFFGQSYRLENQDNPFSEGSGLSDQYSDFVGRFRLQGWKTGFDYSFRLDGRQLTANRHELNLNYNGERYDFSGYYLYLEGLEDSSIPETREQVVAQAGYKLNENWRLKASGVYDFGDLRTGVLRSSAGFDYMAECYTLSVEANRNFTDESSGESDTSITFRIGLKNLGALEQN